MPPPEFTKTDDVPEAEPKPVKTDDVMIRAKSINQTYLRNSITEKIHFKYHFYGFNNYFNCKYCTF